MRDHRRLHRLDRVKVNGTLLVRAHQVRHAEHGDLVDGFQAREPASLGDIADIVVGIEPN